MEIKHWKNNLNETIIKSIIWNTIIDLFSREKNIDITPYLISITINKNNIKIKTNKPIINTELLTIDDKIKDTLKEKFKKMWIKFYDFEVKYV